VGVIAVRANPDSVKRKRLRGGEKKKKRMLVFHKALLSRATQREAVPPSAEGVRRGRGAGTELVLPGRLSIAEPKRRLIPRKEMKPFF